MTNPASSAIRWSTAAHFFYNVMNTTTVSSVVFYITYVSNIPVSSVGGGSAAIVLILLITATGCAVFWGWFFGRVPEEGPCLCLCPPAPRPAPSRPPPRRRHPNACPSPRCRRPYACPSLAHRPVSAAGRLESKDLRKYMLGFTTLSIVMNILAFQVISRPVERDVVGSYMPFTMAFLLFYIPNTIYANWMAAANGYAIDEDCQRAATVTMCHPCACASSPCAWGVARVAALPSPVPWLPHSGCSAGTVLAPAPVVWCRRRARRRSGARPPSPASSSSSAGSAAPSASSSLAR